VSAGDFDPVETVEAALRALEAEELNAVITLCADEALARARSRPQGPLAGVPLLVKDLFDTAGIRTTYGSQVYGDHVPRRTAAAVERLEQAGAIVVAKSNLDEFAWGTTCQNPYYGTVRNPTHPGRVAGGSSGGNAAALAAGLVPLALGSDTGGSIRMPAACCEVAGFKPTLGAVSTEGALPLCPSFDTVGPMARSFADCGLMFSLLTGRRVPEPRLAGLTVGLLTRAPLVAPGDPAPPDARAERYAARLEELGARVVPAELPGPRVDVWPLFNWEAAQSHRETYPSRRDEYSTYVREKIDAAQHFTREQADASREALLEWRERARRELAVDLLVSPTLGFEELPADDVWELDVRVRMSEFTRPFNYLGWAAAALGPLQLAGPSDEVVLAAALAWEQANA
jgi:aspartyl-tRNA(Asn)/glutamyl-tRNA(Gln) amidotransferase subunit A